MTRFKCLHRLSRVLGCTSPLGLTSAEVPPGRTRAPISSIELEWPRQDRGKSESTTWELIAGKFCQRQVSGFCRQPTPNPCPPASHRGRANPPGEVGRALDRQSPSHRSNNTERMLTGGLSVDHEQCAACEFDMVLSTGQCSSWRRFETSGPNGNVSCSLQGTTCGRDQHRRQPGRRSSMQLTVVT